MHIHELTLFTSNLADQYQFYVEELDFPHLQHSTDAFTLQVGATRLTFRQRAGATPYHFAINIPHNQVAKGRDWLRARATILRDGDRKVQDFSAWNAEAMYFYDADKNVVEFIARRNLGVTATGDFTPQELIEVSEIGLPVLDVKEAYRQLHQQTDIPIFDGSLDKFCAIGDEHGLFICIDRSRKQWYPNDDVAPASAFIASVEIDGESYRVSFEEDIIRIEKS